MSFLYPAFLAAALAIAVPIVLHLLRRDAAPEVPFTAVRLLRRGPVERSRRRRLRDLLLLAARVAAILLLAAAFARPYMAARGDAGLRVVAVDRSFSMAAPGVFERARELARAAIDEAGGERVALIAFDDRADVVSPAGSAADARSALDRLQPGVRHTRYAVLVDRLAALDDEAGGTMVVVTDLQRAGSEPNRVVSLPPGWRIDVREAGRAAGNLAVTAVQYDHDRVLATVRNDWPVRKSGRLRIAHGATEEAGEFAVEAAATADVAVNLRVPADAGLSVAIDDPGGLPADNVRHMVIGGGVRPRVLLIASAADGQGAFYLARALDSVEGEAGFDVDVAGTSRLSRQAAGRLRASAAIVLTGTRGLDRRTRDALVARVREGAGLLVTATPDVEPAVLSAMFGWRLQAALDDRSQGATLAATDPRHPIFRPFGPLLANLGMVRVQRAWRVEEEQWTVPARFSDGRAALLERREGNGRVLLFATDLDRRWNDFPLHPSFVPFAVETARYASARDAVASGLLVSDTPDGLEPRPGLQRDPRTGRIVAVNVDIRESDPAPLPSGEFAALFGAASPAAHAAGLQAVQIEAGQAWWRYGLFLMLAALVAESFLGRVRSE